MDYFEKHKSLIKELPKLPGVYQFIGKTGEIIYVGKASNLKNRVSSYFKKNHESGKIRVLVSKIEDVQYIVVDNESEALLLENNLIKKLQPRYNVLLKDDKTYPWICIKNEKFPRVFSTRTLIKDGSEYYGPFTSGKFIKQIIELIRQLYKTRTCNYNMEIDKIKEGRYKICLEFHIGNCLAPCIGQQTEEAYNEAIEEIKNILKGKVGNVVKDIKNKMKNLSDSFKYEEAELLNKKLYILENHINKSTIVNRKINNVDVFSFTEDEKSAFVNFMGVVDGAVIQSYTIEMRKRLNENKEELLGIAITEIRQKIISKSKEIILPFAINYSINNIKFIIPQKGDKKKLLDLSLRNAYYFRKDVMKKREKADFGKNFARKLESLKTDLHLKSIPDHIECFDNSNIQGSYPVASCVVFKNGKPSKNEYRQFNIKTVKGQDDFASMEEVIYRRYKRMLDEKKSLPQLIIIDGGKGQLRSASKSLIKLKLTDKIAMIGIAKRLEEIFFAGDNVPLYLDKNLESLRLIQQIRNEAHRFGIKFHRQKRSIGQTKSELDEINGIGQKTQEILLKEFKSVEKIKIAEKEELAKIISRSRAEIIYSYFRKNKYPKD
ncbi:excinuclease ABC subunit UvrC [Bacteroidota bacterium]